MYGLGIVKGLVVTLKTFFARPFTVQYPDDDLPRFARNPTIARLLHRMGIAPGLALPQAPRYRGMEFVWYEDRCTGCATCAKYCPLGIIKIVTKPNPRRRPDEGNFYDIQVFDIDTGRCMFCGLCVDACPYDALFMGSHFECAQYSRQALVVTVEELRQREKRPSQYFVPLRQSQVQEEAARHKAHRELFFETEEGKQQQ